MRKIIPALCTLLLLAGLLPAAAQQPGLLQADEAFRLKVLPAPEGGAIFEWEIADGYYLYRDHMEAKAANGDTPVALETPDGTREDDPNFGVSEVYYGEAEARLAAGEAAEILLTYQGCKKDSICYPPETRKVNLDTFEITAAASGFGLFADAPQQVQTPARSAGTSAAGFMVSQEAAAGGMVASLLADGGALWVVGSFLVFGLLLAFTPCVLPMYPILSATLARSGETLTPRRGFALSLAYVLAMAAAFGLLGIAAAWSGQNLQIVLQSPYAVATVAAIFTILALSMFGLFDIQLPSAWVSRVAGAGSSRRGSLGGAAAIGFTSALIVGPCVTAPLAAALLYIAQTGDAVLGAAALFALGLGQGLPLIAFGTFGSRALPKAGGWMEYVKYAFGFVLLGLAVWMASRLLPAPLTLALWAALAMTAAAFIGAFDLVGSDASAGRRLVKGGGMALALYALILGVGAASGGSDPLRPLAHFSLPQETAQTAAPEFAGISSATELQSVLAAASSEKRPTLVYFTADWCVTCAGIEREVLPARQVAENLSGFRRIKVDLSRLDDTNRSLMRDLAVIGPPTMIFFGPDKAEIDGTRLIGEIGVDALVASATLAGK
ncbi:protein-disulfide reductase DsbD [Aquamicrobium defluvii]|uniref:Cytochrome C biogenesis protein n=1 Tax=Aquamicrobium defluvii TaxID=69279 RepID=A0A011TDF1_9HYPH|nr:protein-disulfide reductase DsbD [Aquamicrobium defluvii]EXL09694.1 cytochrome C biogenesis protein [Aquamicrobium defluvii]EZQ16273.1 cytochrome C biogenesis protein [Halopseudomonas bauzanensis]TDR36815.1 thiol:disulfide interchange protein DsbD [Aquamicrobium defluvii]